MPRCSSRIASSAIGMPAILLPAEPASAARMERGPLAPRGNPRKMPGCRCWAILDRGRLLSRQSDLRRDALSLGRTHLHRLPYRACVRHHAGLDARMANELGGLDAERAGRCVRRTDLVPILQHHLSRRCGLAAVGYACDRSLGAPGASVGLFPNCRSSSPCRCSAAIPKPPICWAWRPPAMRSGSPGIEPVETRPRGRMPVPRFLAPLRGSGGPCPWSRWDSSPTVRRLGPRGVAAEISGGEEAAAAAARHALASVGDQRGLGVGRTGVSLSVVRLGKRFPVGFTALGLAMSAGVAAAVTAIQLLPVVEFTQLTSRAAGGGPHDIYPFSIAPIRIVELLWPNFSGIQVDGNNHWMRALKLWDTTRRSGCRPCTWVG